jgi:phenylalanyl-tRNA synthetase beta chain
MRIPVSWLRELCPTDLSVDQIAELIGRQGIHVEGVLKPWDGIVGVTVAEVLSVEDHPDSDKLCVARVTDGTEEMIVCAGVRNFAAGDLVPWAKPGSRVPVLPEPLAPRKLRGVVSNGMLCSPRELNVADVHSGIMVLNDEPASVGQDFVTAFGLDEDVLDIEVEPNRPDFLSILGVAREVSAGTGVPIMLPDAALATSGGRAADIAAVRIDAPDVCPRYIARVIEGVSPGAMSPIKAQARLTACGMRPISAIVDATNYAMLELGQPLHGFDMDLLAGPGIVVRTAHPGERIVTLDDQERALWESDLLICDLEKPVAIAGVMGGATSEVSERTTNILLESAYFTRTGILRTARHLDLHSEASHRFERGTDPEGLERAADRAASLMQAWAGGSVLDGYAGAGVTPTRHSVSMRPSRASALLGHDVSPELCLYAFDRLGFAQVNAGDAIEVEVPGYRVDVDREVDLIEEVARIEGYDRIGTSVPSIGQSGGEPAAYVYRQRIREALVRAGLREVRLLSFASAEDLAFAGDEDAIQVANPLLADERYMRTRLLPGLLRGVALNQARGVRSVAVFEVGEVFAAGDPVDQRTRVAFALTGPADEGWDADGREFDVLDAKGVLEILATEVGVASWELGDPHGVPLHPARSTRVSVGGHPAGELGEIHPRIAGTLGLTGRVAVCELEVDVLREASTQEVTMRDVPRFPPLRRDLAFIVPASAAAADVAGALRAAAGGMLSRALLFDVFRGGSIPEDSKSLAFELEFRAEDRTLTDEEAEEVVSRIVARLGADFGAQLRSGG